MIKTSQPPRFPGRFTPIMCLRKPKSLGSQGVLPRRLQTAQGEQRALPRFAGLVAKRLHQLHVSARARAGEFHEHVRSLAQLRGNANTSHATTCHYKHLSASTAKLLIFLDRDAKTQRKTPLFCPQVSNFGALTLCRPDRHVCRLICQSSLWG